MSYTQERPMRVLVLGGGYGGLAAGLNLLDLCQGKTARFYQTAETKTVTSGPKIPIKVKFVDERDGYYHLISTPLVLASEEYAKKAFVRYDEIPALTAPEVSWAQGSVVSVDAEKKTALIRDGNTGETYEEAYDYLISSTGLKRSWPAVPQSLSRKEYLEETGAHIKRVKAAERVLVVGGGAVGIEMAAELALVYPGKKVTLVHSRNRLLSAEPIPDDFKDLTVQLLNEAGVEVKVGKRVKESLSIGTEENPCYDVQFTDGTSTIAEHVIMAISYQTPITSYLPSAALDNDGYVKVAATMELLPNIPNPSYHYAIGDICSWSGIKRCGGAMAMGYYAAFNIHQKLLSKQTGEEAKPMLFPEVPPMIAIAIGKKAIMLSPVDGTTHGEAVLEMMFRDDLGFAICWDYLQLGVDPLRSIEAEVLPEKGKDLEVKVNAIDSIDTTCARMESITV